MGKVVGENDQPIAGAQLALTSSETGITRRKTTNEKGEFSILFPDGGGSYTLKVNFIGYAPFSTQVTRQADEDRLVVPTIVLSHNAQVLSAVTVRATNTQPAQDRPTAGSVERNLSAAQLDRLPIDKGDLNSIASLAPGVIGLGGTDSTAASFSVAGQPTNQNQITLDGLSFGSGSVPSEAVRSTRVITNTYDVSRGQFTGGQVASTTRGGTNNVQGVFTYALRDPDLEFVDESSATFGQKYMQNSLSFGTGGPIIEDEMFIFGAGSVSRRTNALSSLLAANTQTLTRLGASQDSVTRFLGRLNTIGVRATLPGIPDERLNDNASAIVRYDWSIGEANTLTLRGDWRGQLQNGTRINATSVPSTGGELHTLGGGIMATLTSHLNGFINEARIYQSSDRSETSPYLIAPDGRVNVASTLTDGTLSVTSLQFGGNPALPQETHSRLLEGSDEVSWVSTGGAHRVKLGGLINADRATIGNINNRYGTFFYNSLSDFENNKPAQFTRTIAGHDRLAGSNNLAIYLGDAWRRSPRFQLVYGTRFEASQFPNTPEFNPEVQTLFGFRTDRVPSEVHVSPRMGFTYNMGAPAVDQGRGGRGGGANNTANGGRGGAAPADTARAATPAAGATTTAAAQTAQNAGGRGAAGGGRGGPAGFNQGAWTIRGGLGEFRGKISSNLVANTVDATGIVGGQSTLTCIGSAVPVPDWTSYLNDQSTIPTQCSDGSLGTTTIGLRRNVSTFQDGFSAPKVWRASLGGNRRIFERYNLNLDGSLAYGVNQTGSRDLNLTATPVFTLANEGGRPVYSAPGTIIPTTGATTITASRLHPEYGSVSEITSVNHSLSTQFTVSLGGVTLRGISLNGSYTFLRSRDQQNGFGVSGGGFGSSSTAGDPNVTSWGTSDLERRHSMLGTVTIPARACLDITMIGRYTAGQRYTPTVSGDVNGDGSRNDRAFIFNPAATADTAVGNSIGRIIANSPDRTRECIQSQLGTIATRNSCTAPWSPSLDMQLNIKPDALGLGRRFTLQIQVQNGLVGLDQLLHGDNLHGWGQPVIPDRTLLFVRGFDPATNTFKYQVNEHFGTQTGANSAFRVPFQLGLTGRMTLGQDPARQQIGRMFGVGPDGKPLSKEEWKTRLARVVPNIFLMTLSLNDSLKLNLTAEQKAKLNALSLELAPKADQMAEDLADILTSAGVAPDPAVIGARIQGKTNDARSLAEKTVEQLKGVLTADQFAKLPDNVKVVPPNRGLGGFGGGDQGGGGGGGGNRGGGGGGGGRPPGA